MPPNPEHVKRRVELSDDYHDESAVIEFYTNSALAIRRGGVDEQDSRVWLDNLEKRELLKVLKEEV